MNISRFNVSGVISAAILLAVAAMPVHAVPVTLTANTVEYSFDDSLLGLFGAPAIVGDGLVFTPGGTAANFAAQSLDGAGQVDVSESIEIQVNPLAGFQLTGVNMVEQGNHLIQDPDGWVQATVDIDVNGTPGSATTGASGNFWDLVEGVWDITTDVSVVPTSLFDIKITNTLSASSGNFWGKAFIEKKLMTLTASTRAAQVPAPPIMWLLIIGLLAMVVFRLEKCQDIKKRHMQPSESI